MLQGPLFAVTLAIRKETDATMTKACDLEGSGKAYAMLGAFERSAREYAKAAKCYWKLKMYDSAVCNVIRACESLQNTGFMMDEARDGHRVVSIMLLRETTQPQLAASLMGHLVAKDQDLYSMGMLTKSDVQSDMDLYRYVVAESRRLSEES